MYDEALDFYRFLCTLFLDSLTLGRWCDGGTSIWKAEDLDAEISEAGDLLISDDSKACGQHLWFWRSTGVAVQVGLHLSPVFLLEGVRSLKWKAAPSRKAHSIQTPRIQVNERMLPLSSTRN